MARTDVYTLDRHGGLLPDQEGDGAPDRGRAPRLRQRLLRDREQRRTSGDHARVAAPHRRGHHGRGEDPRRQTLDLPERRQLGSAKVEDPHRDLDLQLPLRDAPDAVAANYHLGKPIGDNGTGFAGTADVAYRTGGVGLYRRGRRPLQQPRLFLHGGPPARHVDRAPGVPAGRGPAPAAARDPPRFIDGFDFIRTCARRTR